MPRVVDSLNTIAVETPRSAGLVTSVLLSACAGGMAWGIRGQYGHETGAMIAGVLVGFVLVLLHGRHLSSLQSARAVSLFALGISIGGSMTYGQTVGLTHDGPLVGNVEAYRWGMLGLAIKGGIWIALGGAMFGMALSGKRYGGLELLGLVLAMVGGLIAGTYIFNQPFDPERRMLPEIYFSDHWYWEPDVDKPRRERWGGLLVALVVLLAYVSLVKRDILACSLGIWGLVAGTVGFPAGQAVQAYNAWHGEWIRTLPTHVVTDHFNWWNMMETTFGFVFGAIIGFAVWLHRRSISVPSDELPAEDRMPLLVELLLLAIHVRLLVAWNFQSIGWLDAVADLAIPMVAIPLVVVMSGKYGAFLVALPVTLLPIAGKTLRQLSFGEASTPIAVGLDLYLVAPMLIATSIAVLLALRTRSRRNAGWFASIGLVTATWLYFGLNDAFFHSPWIWKPWTGRTVNGFLFFVFSLCLTIAAAWYAPALDTPEADEGSA